MENKEYQITISFVPTFPDVSNPICSSKKYTHLEFPQKNHRNLTQKQMEIKGGNVLRSVLSQGITDIKKTWRLDIKIGTILIRQ